MPYPSSRRVCHIYHHHSALESNDECGAVHYHRLTCVAATIIDSNIIETHYCSESVYAYDVPSLLLSLTAKKEGPSVLF